MRSQSIHTYHLHFEAMVFHSHGLPFRSQAYFGFNAGFSVPIGVSEVIHFKDRWCLSGCWPQQLVLESLRESSLVMRLRLGFGNKGETNSLISSYHR